MYKGLDKLPGLSLSEIRSSKYEKNIKKQGYNVERVIGHYRKNIKSLPSNHLLVSILNTIPTGEGVNNIQYMYQIEDMLDEIANAFHLCTSDVMGRVIDSSPWHGSDVSEIVILTNENFKVSSVGSGWMDLEPIRFLSHPSSDLGLPMPDGQSNLGSGLGVSIINLPMLALQYKLWREWVSGMEYRQTTRQFVNSFPIPNSIKSYHDIAMFNVIYNLFSGIIDGTDKVNHSFYLNTYRNDFTDSVDLLINEYINKRVSFTDFISSFRFYDDASILEVMVPPDIRITRQVKWPISVGRMRLFSMMVLWDSRSVGSLNRGDINALKKILKRLKSDKSLSELKSNSVKRLVEQYIDDEILSFL